MGIGRWGKRMSYPFIELACKISDPMAGNKEQRMTSLCRIQDL